jgi:hypothetical protein
MQVHLLFISEIGEETEKHKNPKLQKPPGREWLVEDVFGIGVFSTLVYQVHFVTCEFDSIPVL